MSDSIIHAGVSLGENMQIGKWVELGILPKSSRIDGDIRLVIGNRAHIRSHTMIYAGGVFGDDFVTGHHVLIREFVICGCRVSVGSGSEIEQYVVVGNNVRIHSQCFVAEGTVIEDNVRLAPAVRIASDRHPLLPNEKKIRKGPHIKSGAYVGMGVTILPGITIGANVLIGAGSVVTKDIPDNVVAYGNPAKVAMTREEYLQKLSVEEA